MPRWSIKATPYLAAPGQVLVLFSKSKNGNMQGRDGSMKASPILAALCMLGRFRVLLFFSKRKNGNMQCRDGVLRLLHM